MSLPHLVHQILVTKVITPETAFQLRQRLWSQDLAETELVALERLIHALATDQIKILDPDTLAQVEVLLGPLLQADYDPEALEALMVAMALEIHQWSGLGPEELGADPKTMG